MTTSRRVAERKVARFERSALKKSSKKGYPVGRIVLGFFVFVVVGSSLFQIIRTATNLGLPKAGGNGESVERENYDNYIPGKYHSSL